jgi:hypothetical protein
MHLPLHSVMIPGTRSFVLYFFLFWVFNMNAQHKMTKKEFIADSLKIVKPKLIRPQFRLDNRLTFLSNEKLNITGLDAGILVKNKLRLALGYYYLSGKLTALKKYADQVEYQGQYDLKYGALNVEFIYKNTRFFSLGMPLEFGFGGNTLNYVSELGSLKTAKQSGFIAMSYFGLSGTFKPIRWIGLKVACGFRKTLLNQVKDLAHDGFYSSVGLSIDLREIIRDGRMFKLKRRYRKNADPIETAVDLITD